MNNNLVELLQPVYKFKIEHPTLDGELSFSVRILEFGLSEYALTSEQLDDTQLIEVDDVDTCIFEVVTIDYVSNQDGNVTDLTTNTDINTLINERCWCMIVEQVLPDYLTIYNIDESI